MINFNEEQFKRYINNSYFALTYLIGDFKKFFNEEDEKEIFYNIKKLYNKEKLEKLSEAGLEEVFIKPILKELGYTFLYEHSKKSQGKNYTLDFLLFEDDIKKDEYLKEEDKASVKNILAVLESKKFRAELDTNKIDFVNNPHFQLINYLNTFRLDSGISTNGSKWRFYDVSHNESQKVFFEFDLEGLLNEENEELALTMFSYFYNVFKKDNLVKAKDIKEANIQAKLEVEEELRQIIYGKDSLVNKIGVILHNKTKADNKSIFENTLTFVFRLLFIAYFEDKFEHLLFKIHKNYKHFSLRSVYKYLCQNKEEQYLGGRKLRELFDMLDSGESEVDIPLLNGGLFSKKQSPLLNEKKIFKDSELFYIIDNLLKNKQENVFYRNFATLSITHLGNIYENLLEFEFKTAFEPLIYAIYGKEEGYLDSYDLEKIKNKKIKVHYEEEIKQGSIYLSNNSGNRKSTASFYTPQIFTKFMSESSIDGYLEEGSNILDLKIIDNACGSGHFLVEILNYLTKRSLEKIQSEFALKSLLEEEKSKIKQNLQDINLEIKLDDLAVLKRILLKKSIYALDLNPFSVELARLALWLDTFIFATPLSFIEHHIKNGNALIGSTLKDLDDLAKEDEKGLFNENLKSKVQTLTTELKKLANINDTTKEDIKQSKEIFKNLEPKINELNKLLNLCTLYKFNDIEELGFNFTDFSFTNTQEKYIKKAKELKEKYTFFNYEIDFAEVFTRKNSGFDIVIGNPPWDKLKIENKDFFSYYRSSFRKMSVSEKKELEHNILTNYIGAKEEFAFKKDLVLKTNEFLKRSFELNRTGGDNNIYSFFLEHNLKLLNDNACLNYLTPSSIINKDSFSILRKHILKNYDLEHFYQFENTKLFKRVATDWRIATYKIHNKKSKKTSIKMRFMKKGLKGVKDPFETKDAWYYLDSKKGKKDDIINYKISDVEKLDKENMAFFEIKQEKDLKLLKKFYAKFKTLNPNYIDFKNEIHLTSDNDLFKEVKDDMFLYEGKAIHQFNPHWSKDNKKLTRYYLNKKEFENEFKSKEINRLLSDLKEQGFSKKQVLEILNVKEKNDLEKFIVYDKDYLRMGFRAIQNAQGLRTVISSFLPKNTVAGNTLYLTHNKKYIIKNNEIDIELTSLKRMLFIMSIFNSFVFDYIARFILDKSVNKTYIMRLPVLQPTNSELENNKDYITLIKNSIALTSYYDKENFNELLKLYEDVKIPKYEKDADLLKIENDLIVAKIYDASYEDLEHMVSKEYFKVFNEKNQAYIQRLLNKSKEFL